MTRNLRIQLTLVSILISFYFSSAQSQIASVYTVSGKLPAIESCCADNLATLPVPMTEKSRIASVMEECLQELGLNESQLVDLKNEKADIKGFKLTIEKKSVTVPKSNNEKVPAEKFYLKGRSYEKVTRIIRYDDVEIKTAIEPNINLKLDRNENIKLVPKLHPEIFETNGYIEFFAAVSSPLQIQLTKPNGEVMRNLQINNMPRPGKNRIQFNLIGLKPGVYYIRFEDEFGISQQRIIKSENSIGTEIH